MTGAVRTTSPRDDQDGQNDQDGQTGFRVVFAYCGPVRASSSVASSVGSLSWRLA